MCNRISVFKLLITIVFSELLIVYVLSSLVKSSKDKNEMETKNFEELYAVGTRSYLDNDWENCIKYIEKSIEKYKQFQKSMTRCKVKCSDIGKLLKPSFEEDIEDLYFYEKMVKTTLCLLKSCDHLKMDIHKDILRSFHERAPYEYLQLCYYKKGDIPKAASAAFTHHVYDLNYNISRENVEWYKKQLPMEKSLIDREAFDHGKYYEEGVVQYRNKDWGSVIESMENGVKSFILTEEECRLSCEKPFDMGWYPDFVASVSNHYTFVLKCKQTCQRQISRVGDQQIDNMLPLMYFYLMFAYYKANNLEKAASCIATHQLLLPGDEEMENNKKYFVEEEAINIDWLVSREEALKYYKRDRYEKHLIEFINKQFVFDDEDQMDIYSTIGNEEMDKNITIKSKEAEKIHKDVEQKVPTPPPIHGNEL